MSLVTFIKDYFEIAANDFLSVDTVTVQEIIPHLGQYLWENSGRLIYYLISFEWLRDNVFLPLQIPTALSATLPKNLLPGEKHITFLEISSIKDNIFLIFFGGFFNSFFLSLPFSVSHFITLRRLMIQGIPAGIYAGLGTIFGQLLFVGSIVSGFRFLLTSWLTFEPYNYFIGIFIIVSIVHDMVTQRSLSLIGGSRINLLTKIFFLNFFVSWVEQSCFGGFLSNVTILKQPSIFEILARQTAFQFTIVQISYLLGILIGSIFFTCFFGWGFYFLFHYCATLYATYYSRWIHRLNSGLLILILGITLNSYCDYGANFLVTGPLGFISEDKALKTTIFFPVDIVDPIKNSPGTQHDLLTQANETKPLDFDPAIFDKGLYLQPSTFSSKTIEDFTFRGEHAWNYRNDYEANSWMRRFKDRRSQKTIKRAVKFLLDKGKQNFNQKIAEGTEIQPSFSQKKEIQFIPTHNSESSVNELFFKNKFEEKSLTKIEEFKDSKVKDFLQSLSSTEYEKEATKGNNPSLLEVTTTDQNTILHQLKDKKTSLFKQFSFNNSKEIEKETYQLGQQYTNLEKRTKSEKYDFKEKNIDWEKFLYFNEDNLSFDEIKSLESLQKLEAIRIRKESINEMESEDEKIKTEKLVIFLNKAFNTYPKRVEQMYKLSKKNFLEDFYQKETDTILYKKFYYSNPLYKILLNVDIDNFLSRQPNQYQLTPIQEKMLFEKRQVLHNYYDNLSRYTTLLDNTQNTANLLKLDDIETSLLHKQPFSVAANSYSNRVYNQQFKGTFHVVRKLFAITPESKRRSLKYDQPLFSDRKKVENTGFLHEDLLDEKLQTQAEHLIPKSPELNNPYLVKTDPIPLYTGWDAELRQFVITTRFQARSSTGIGIFLPTENEIKQYSTLSKFVTNKEKNQTSHEISFTHWPLTKPFLKKPKSKAVIEYETLFESKYDPVYEKTHAFGVYAEPEDEDDRKPWEYTRVPTSVTVVPGSNRDFSVPYPFPRGGGFVWPGNPSLPTSVKEILSKMSLKNLTQNLDLKQILTKKKT